MQLDPANKKDFENDGLNKPISKVCVDPYFFNLSQRYPYEDFNVPGKLLINQ